MNIENTTTSTSEFNLPLYDGEKLVKERGYCVIIKSGMNNISKTDFEALNLIQYFHERILIGDYKITKPNKEK